jgi:hypothetical protein
MLRFTSAMRLYPRVDLCPSLWRHCEAPAEVLCPSIAADLARVHRGHVPHKTLKASISICDRVNCGLEGNPGRGAHAYGIGAG